MPPVRCIDLFDHGVALAADRAALVEGDRELSFPAAQQRSVEIARALLASGLRPGQHAAVYAGNGIDAFLCVLGILRAGAVWLAVNPLDSLESNVQQLLQFDCDWLFVDARHAAAGDALRARRPDIAGIASLEHDALAAWRAERAPRWGDAPLPEVPADSLAAIFATGGTTGRPKGVMTTQANFIAFCTTADPRSGEAPGVLLAAAPMTHVTGRLAIAALHRGDTVVVLPQLKPAAVLDAIERHRVTDLFLPPTALYALLDHPGLATRDLSSLRHLNYGAAPMSVAQLKRALALLGPVLTQGYGQTEAPLGIARLAREDHFVDGEVASDERLSSCGKPTGAAEVAVMDDAGRLLPQGECGEIVVRGPIVMKGYYKDPDATAAASRFGWHHTGDVGRFDADGYLHIVDRLKDMIISGGFNVYSAEVEQALMHEAPLEDCAVIGVPDAYWGEAVVAVIVPRAGVNVADLDTVALQARLRERLGPVKTPKRIEVRDALPRSAAGKVLKRALREQLDSPTETSR